MSRLNVNMILFFMAALAATASSAEETGSNKSTPAYSETGQASYYADKFQSRKTASGELYDAALLTAAHKKLPFGTKVEVTNVVTKASVVVKINDRGPFTKGRVIDLSKAAFKRIGDIKSGVITVKIKVTE